MINNRYNIVKKIGEGRSPVYLCEDIEFQGSKMAIKFLPRSADQQESEYFRREYFTLQKLEHPGIIKTYEIGTALHLEKNDDIEAGSAFITMEHFNAVELLKSPFVLNEADIKKIIKQLCSVLYYMHQSGYIYYDLKPENILVSLGTKEPIVKLIDMGLTEKSDMKNESAAKGTAMYIAPELLKNQPHDNRVDLYSLGIILYRIIYDKFPFSSNDELEIYKAHVDNEFDFPSSNKFSSEFIKVSKKLLSKNPDERYLNALQVLSDLNIEIDETVTNDFLPVKVFSSRTDIINILSGYIKDKSSTEIFTLKGYEGAGKSTVINYLYELYQGSIRIQNLNEFSGVELIRHLINRIIYSEKVYSALSHEELDSIINVVNGSNIKLLENLPSIVATLSEKTDIILLIDDYNLLDDFASEMINGIVPILQKNNVKIIIAESADHPYYSSDLNNVKELLIRSFTDDEIKEFINLSYNAGFKNDELYNLISQYSDLLPGSIIAFLKDIIMLKIMRFGFNGEDFINDEEKLEEIMNSQDLIYELRLQKISGLENEIVKIISAFDVGIDAATLAKIINQTNTDINTSVENLQMNNVLQKSFTGTTLIISSDAFKQYIYSLVEDKIALHLKVATAIENSTERFNPLELSRHYELANQFDKSYEILSDELKDVEQHSAFNYMRKILEHMIELPLNDEKLNEVKFKLCDVLLKMSDYKLCLQTIQNVNCEILNAEQFVKLNIVEASSLIGLGEFERGREMYINLLNSTNSDELRNELLTEIAYTEFELKNYDSAVEYSNELLQDESLPSELKGRCWNLIAMCSIYSAKNLENALNEFSNAILYYQEAGLPKRISGVEVNVGNIYNMLGKYELAEEHWLQAYEINKSVGDLNQEGIILLNFGVFYFDHQKFEKAIENYKDSIKIFLSIGNETNRAYVLFNLAETYLTICEYNNALNSLQLSIKIFEDAKNYEEIADVLILFCKLYSKLNNAERLKNCLDYLNKIVNENKLSKKHQAYLKYANILYYLIAKVPIEKMEQVVELKRIFKELEERNRFSEVTIIFIELLILRGEYKPAINQLKEGDFVELIVQNSILEAQREFLLGIISEHYGTELLSAPLLHFEKAYDLLKNQSITECTWKSLLKIAEIYTSRGNLNKAKEYYLYARELINFIAENIQSPQLRNSFLNQYELKNTLTRIESYYVG